MFFLEKFACQQPLSFVFLAKETVVCQIYLRKYALGNVKNFSIGIFSEERIYEC